MKYSFIKFFLFVLGLLPGRVASFVLRRVAPSSWAPAWGRSACLGVLEDVFLSRF